MKRKIFQSKELEWEFTTNGFVILDFLDSGKVEDLRQQVIMMNPADHFKGMQNTFIHPQSFHCTFFDENQQYKNQVYNLLNNLYKDILANTLYNYKVVQANIFLKPPHTGEVSPHQNLTIVDEMKYSSVSLWCPLIDVSEENGALKLVPRSQGKFAKYRNTIISWPLLDFFRNEGKKYLKSINVKAGQLLILNDSIIHSSPTNNTDTARTILHVLAIPQEASPIFCDLEQDDVKVYQVEENFWQTNIPGAKPPQNALLLKTEKYTDQTVTESEFLKQLRE